MQRHSDTLILVLHEIYGKNAHMSTVCKALNDEGFDILCPDFLQRGLPFGYDQQAEAYRYFTEEVGFVRAAAEVKALIATEKQKYKHVFILGFSVGATVAWLCSDEQQIDGTIGYYGSRIRDCLEVTPSCPVLLFFPEQEPSFHVNDLIAAVTDKGAEVHQLPGQHGFSDPFSPVYNEKSARSAFTAALTFIKDNKNRTYR